MSAALSLSVSGLLFSIAPENPTRAARLATAKQSLFSRCGAKMRKVYNTVVRRGVCRRTMEAKTQPDLDGRIAELKTQRDSLEAFRADVKDADKTELKAMFGGLMSEDRSHRALDGSVSMLVTLTDDGEIDAAHFVTVRRGGYVKPSIARKYDAHLSTGTGAFVSYQNLRQAVLSDLAQALEGVNDNIRALK